MWLLELVWDVAQQRLRSLFRHSPQPVQPTVEDGQLQFQEETLVQRFVVEGLGSSANFAKGEDAEGLELLQLNHRDELVKC